MTYRLEDLDISAEDPYLHDALQRKDLVSFLSGLIGRLSGPFVMAIDSPWGSGKSTLVRMLMDDLIKQDFECIYFNAWKVDHTTDPLIALVSAIDRVSLPQGESRPSFKEHINKAKKIVTLIGKRVVVNGVKLYTASAVDLDIEAEKLASLIPPSAIEDAVDAFATECDLIEEFRSALTAGVECLPRAGKKPNLIFFIDEMDRCRPNFAIELLERIKHLFDTKNIIFVLAIDKQQLEASTSAIYGSQINAPEYLRKFIDLEYGLPTGDLGLFTETLLNRFGLGPFFKARQSDGIEIEKGHFIRFFTSFAELMDLSLRARERCFTRLRVVLDLISPAEEIDPIWIALLIILRSNRPQLFRDLVSDKVAPEFVFHQLSSTKQLLRPEYIEVRSDIYAYTLAAHTDLKLTKTIFHALSIQTLPSDDQLARDSYTGELQSYDREYHQLVCKKLSQLSAGSLATSTRLRSITAKVDLAGMIRD